MCGGWGVCGGVCVNVKVNHGIIMQRRIPLTNEAYSKGDVRHTNISRTGTTYPWQQSPVPSGSFVCFTLCTIDSYQQANAACSSVLFVKGIFQWYYYRTFKLATNSDC